MSPLVNERKPFDKDRLADYVDVKERLRLFHARYPEGSVQAEPVPEWSDEARICMVAYAYRTPDDPRPGKGYSWLEIPGKTPYTRGSEIENAETSAWGRAIGSLGIGIEKSIASQDEIASKEDDGQSPPPPIIPDVDGFVTLDGTVAGGKSAPVDLLLRQSSDGPMLGFVLVAERTGRTQVVAVGQLADDLWDAVGHAGENIQGKPATVTGRLERVAWTKDGKDMPPYKRLTLERITALGWTLPDAPVEADSLPLFEEPVP